MTGRNKIQHLSAYMVEQLLRRMDKQFTPPYANRLIFSNMRKSLHYMPNF